MNTSNISYEAPNIFNTFLASVDSLDFYLQIHCKYYLSFSFQPNGQAVVLAEAHHLVGRFCEYELSVDELKDMIECSDELDELLENTYRQLMFILQNHSVLDLKQIMKPCGLEVSLYGPNSLSVTGRRCTLFIPGVKA